MPCAAEFSPPPGRHPPVLPIRRFLSAALLSLAASLGAAPTAPVVAPRILMQAHTLNRDQKQHAQTIDLMVEAGVRMIRDEIFWHAVEMQPGKYAIPADALANLKYTRSKGLKTLLILDYANAFVDGNKAPYTPEGRAAYARYAEFMARETKGLVDYFEIWNEPNIDGFWSPRANAKDYAELVKVAYPAVKRGNPDALVVAGALSGAKVDFTQAVLKEGAYNFFDAWSVHPYITPADPDRAKLFDGQLAAVRNAMQPYGEPKPLWVTEFGYPTHDGGVSEPYQADMLARGYIGSMTQLWQPVFGWYWFGPDGPDPELNEDRFGLIRNDWSKKPSFHALKTVTGYLGGMEYVRPLVDSPAVSAFLFRSASAGNPTTVTAIWSRDRDKHQVRVANVPRGNLIDVTGMGFPVEAFGEAMYIDATRSPVLLCAAQDPQITVLASPAVELKPAAEIITATAPLRADVVFHSVPNIEVAGAIAVPMSEGLSGVAAADRKSVVYTVKADAPKQERRMVALPAGPDSRIPFAYLVASTRVAAGATMLFTPKLPNTVELSVLRNPPVTEGDSQVLWNVSPVPSQGHFALPPSAGDAPTTAALTLKKSYLEDAVYTVHAGTILPSGEVVQDEAKVTFMTSPRATAPVVVDGVLGEWAKRQPIRLENRDQISSYWREWHGPADASAAVYTAWDTEWFYVAAEVQDNDLSGPVTDPDNYYKNDGLELYFDTDFEGDRTQGHYSDDDHQLGLFAVGDKEVAWHFSHGNGPIEGAKVIFNRAPQPGQTISGKACRYLIEAAIPVGAVKLHAGKTIGFNVALSDDDDANTIHPFGPEVQLIWNGAKGGWQDPRKFAQLFLVEPESHDSSPGH